MDVFVPKMFTKEAVGKGEKPLNELGEEWRTRVLHSATIKGHVLLINSPKKR